MEYEDFYKDMYKRTDVGFDAVADLLPKTTCENLRHDMALHMDGYRHFGNIAKKKLEMRGAQADEAPAIAKVPAKIGMSMHTLFDSSPSHIAELMINGSQMTMLALQKQLNRLKEQNTDTGEEEELCRRMMDFEEDNVRRMQHYV